MMRQAKRSRSVAGRRGLVTSLLTSLLTSLVNLRVNLRVNLLLTLLVALLDDFLSRAHLVFELLNAPLGILPAIGRVREAEH